MSKRLWAGVMYRPRAVLLVAVVLGCLGRGHTILTPPQVSWSAYSDGSSPRHSGLGSPTILFAPAARCKSISRNQLALTANAGCLVHALTSASAKKPSTFRCRASRRISSSLPRTSIRSSCTCHLPLDDISSPGPGNALTSLSQHFMTATAFISMPAPC